MAPSETTRPDSSVSPRLYVIQARTAPVAVVFRRGPSKQTLVLRWNTREHTVEEGQWFRGRIYERRCDLSPNGSKMIYLAANYKSPVEAWTAISRPPFLTAIAFWENMGAWGGGGLFRDEQTVEANLRESMLQPRNEPKLPKRVRVRPFGEYSGHGEDDPLHSALLARDGWQLIAEGLEVERSFDAPIWIEMIPPRVWRKTRGDFAIERRIVGYKEQGGPWVIEEFAVVDPQGAVLHEFGRCDWADWSFDGELLLARHGVLHVVDVGDRGTSFTPRGIVDLTDKTFRELAPTDAARQWGDALVPVPD